MANQRRRRLWPVIGSLTGVAFVIEALLHAPGVAYAITAVACGAAYTIVAALTRSGSIAVQASPARTIDQPDPGTTRAI